MPEKFFGGFDFGTSGARICIINSKKDLIYSNSVNYKYEFINPQSWILSFEELLDNSPNELKINIVKF